MRAVVFFDQGTQRAVRVVVAHSPLDPATDVRYYWLGFLAATTIARPLEQGGRPIRYLEVGPGTEGHAFEALIWPERSPEEVAAVARDLAARSAAAGWEVAELRAWANGPGAIAITLRLTERGLLDGRADWSTTLFGSEEWSYSRLLRIEAPDGSLLAGGGSVGERGGFGRNEPYGPPRDVPPPADLHGPTHLDLTVEDPAYGDGPTRRFRFVLDCDGGASDGIPDVPATCRRLVGDRYALLLPAPPDVVCTGVMGAPSMSLRGTFLGVPVARAFGSCNSLTVQRWMDVLRIPASTAYVATTNDRYGASLVRIVGGTPAERRAARTTLVGVSYGIVERVTFARRNGRRIVTVVPKRPEAYEETRQADVDWVAGQVRRDIVRRLAGHDAAPSGRGVARRIQSRANTLLSRAIRAGWYVRSVRGWNLGPGGAFVVTLRLTERELLGGRNRWVLDVTPDARRERYAVRFAIEAPDGTLVAGGTARPALTRGRRS